MAANSIAASAIDRCHTVKDKDHLAVVVDCVAALDGGVVNGGC
jgi:hypothetical protein